MPEKNIKGLTLNFEEQQIKRKKLGGQSNAMNWINFKNKEDMIFCTTELKTCQRKYVKAVQQ